jgi:hypothetical protein
MPTALKRLPYRHASSHVRTLLHLKTLRIISYVGLAAVAIMLLVTMCGILRNSVLSHTVRIGSNSPAAHFSVSALPIA